QEEDIKSSFKRSPGKKKSLFLIRHESRNLSSSDDESDKLNSTSRINTNAGVEKENGLNTNHTESEKEGFDDYEDEQVEKFHELIEIIEDLHTENLNKPTEEEIGKEHRVSNNISIDDFKFVSYIGKGGFGYVCLYKKKDTGDLFAIKTVDLC